MRISFILVVLFLLSAINIGAMLDDVERSVLDSSIDDVWKGISTIELTPTEEAKSISNIEGFYRVIELGVKFFGALALESLRAGAYFGQDNPEYFEAEFLFPILRLIGTLIIISLLIKPVFYIGTVLVLLVMWIVDKMKNRKSKNLNKMEEKKCQH